MGKICVVGSGPSGAVTALKLLENGFDVTMLDLGFVENSSEDEKMTFSQRKHLKLSYGKSFPYDLNEFNKVHNLYSSKNWFPSKGKYGFSTVWGATWKPFKSLNNQDWKAAYSECDDYIFSNPKNGLSRKLNLNKLKVSRQCTCFEQFENMTKTVDQWQLIVSESQMAIYDESCVFCGSCQIGCTYDAIWDSSSLVSSCESFSTFEYFPNVFIEKILSSGNNVSVLNHEGIESFFDYIFLCAGPIGNATILLKSGLTPSGELNLQDSQMITLPLFSFRSMKKHQGAYTLSGKNIDFQSLSEPQIALHLQLYAHIDLIKDRIVLFIPIFLRKLVGAILNVLKNHLYIGILYVDPTWSGTLKLKFVNDSTEASSDFDFDSNLRRTKNGLNKIAKTFAVVPLWTLAKVGAVGDSYHVGAVEEKVTDGYGRLLRNPKIFVGGSFALPVIEPGPVTMTSMAQCIRMVNNFLQTTKATK